MEYSHKLRICSHVVRAKYSSTLGVIFFFFLQKVRLFFITITKSHWQIAKRKLVTLSMYVLATNKCVFDCSNSYSDIRIFG